MGSPPTALQRVARLYLLLGLAQAAHSIEEMRTHLYEFFWTMTGVLHSYFPGFPQFRWDPDTFAVVNMALIAVLLGTVTFVAEGRGWALRLAGVAAVVEILNGTAHLAAALYFGSYIPGAASAPLLLILGIVLLRELRGTSALFR
ncbi:MAG: HXXEE domain-containing protein [Acidobacteria bacterium]|nr:HXXEE domain-containing protein [Acidobacteriota bacterium]